LPQRTCNIEMRVNKRARCRSPRRATSSRRRGPYLNETLLQYCEQALAQRRSNVSSLRIRVENAVTPLLPHGKARLDTVARELGMSSRTLARRLTAEGLSFGEIHSTPLRSRHALSARAEPFDFSGRMARRLSRSWRILSPLQAMDRNEPEKDARQIAGEPVAELRAIAPSTSALPSIQDALP
jgi:AraC-like DNA-binding protein